MTDVDSDIVEDMKNTPMADKTDDSITIFTFNLTFVKCPCSVFNAKCHYNLYFFNNNNNNNNSTID